MILIALLLSLFPSIFTSVDPRSCSLAYSLIPAESGHIFGFDRQGCDIYARVIYGARASVLVGVLTTALVTVVGALIGSIAGFFGGWVDTILSRITDIFFAIDRKSTRLHSSHVAISYAVFCLIKKIL